uniref:NADH-ubiquinone oxidoreductase chain 5 n=1 Tax=Gloeochaete wittrockiana TaxID=38269 RepID=A0A096Y6U2_9EUKA|nr:NADH dehydrogenase subunit 5 [Gloeochaete wittrockiana]AIM52048.1 NADH dehydrogenase subunit 5 [Gloeochaete wittrockiana]
MYLVIVFLPLVSAIMAGLFGRFLGNKNSAYLATFCLGFTFFLCLIAFYEVGLCHSPCYIVSFPWIQSELFKVNWSFLFDSITVVMLIVVTSVSFLVHMYSIEYMGQDPHLSRFMSYLSFFTFFMLILVTADNFLQMFVGWEGVGLCSYLLINFYFTRVQANKAALKAMIVNRIGDFGLSLGMMALFFTFKTLDYNVVFNLAPLVVNENFCFFSFELNKITVICLLLFVGAVGKSAQLGLHTWLPDAMEGPTPVSALIHAATMVTAGVFLIIRCSPLFELSAIALDVLMVFGSLTAFFAATTGLLQNDVKRVIAYSTCSQLGYMVFACGASSYSVAMFHLANHAFFKALLFLTAGAIIHALRDEQDMRKMGGLAMLLPFAYSMIVIGSLSLMGFPFLTGFYSKDSILELVYSSYSSPAGFAYVLGTLAAFCTAFYSFRLIYLVFLSVPNGYKSYFNQVHETPYLMALPLVLLAFGSIFIGYLTKDLMLGMGTNFWGGSIYFLPERAGLFEAEFIPTNIKILPVCLSLLGAFTACLFYSSFFKFLVYLSVYVKDFYTFLNKKWYFDKIYNEVVGKFFIWFGYNMSFKLIDRGFVELFGPYGMSKLSFNLAKQFSLLQTGFLYHYIFMLLVGVTFFVGILSFGYYLNFWVDTRLYWLFMIGLFFIIFSDTRQILNQ